MHIRFKQVRREAGFDAVRASVIVGQSIARSLDDEFLSLTIKSPWLRTIFHCSVSIELKIVPLTKLQSPVKDPVEYCRLDVACDSLILNALWKIKRKHRSGATQICLIFFDSTIIEFRALPLTRSLALTFSNFLFSKNCFRVRLLALTTPSKTNQKSL